MPYPPLPVGRETRLELGWDQHVDNQVWGDPGVFKMENSLGVILWGLACRSLGLEDSFGSQVKHG